MVEFFVDQFPFASDEVAIEAARFCFASVSDLRIVRPTVLFVGDSYRLEHLRNHWFVNFDVEEEGVLASSDIITICIDASSGEVAQVDWDFSKEIIGVVRVRPASRDA